MRKRKPSLGSEIEVEEDSEEKMDLQEDPGRSDEDGDEDEEEVFLVMLLLAAVATRAAEAAAAAVGDDMMDDVWIGVLLSFSSILSIDRLGDGDGEDDGMQIMCVCR